MFTCVFCGIKINTKSKYEHVYPKWLLKSYFSRKKATLNSKITITKKGVENFSYVDKVRPSERKDKYRFSELKLPVCGHKENNCNGKLDHHFEDRAREPLKKLLKQGQEITDTEEVRAVARWAAKTVLLSRHPKAWHPEFEEVTGKKWSPQGRWSVPHRDMVELCSLGKIPDDLHLWAFIIDPEHTGEVKFEAPSSWVPTGIKLKNAIVSFGVGEKWSDSEKKELTFHLAYRSESFRNPYTDVVNPFSDEGKVKKIWPDPPKKLGLEDLPKISKKSLRSYMKWFP